MTSNADIVSLFLQILSLEILFKDFNNADLMQELRNQDEVYFTKIIQQNEEIIKLLTKGSEKSGR